MLRSVSRSGSQLRTASEALKSQPSVRKAVRTAMTAGSEGGGVAGLDGMLEPEQLADSVVETLAEERFLVLPHPEVLTYMRRKTEDYDRWLGDATSA